MHETVYSTATSKYEFYERQSHSRYNRRCIDNSITGCNKCVGYCQYNEHPGFLTEKLREQHNCIEKQCFHYIAKPEKKKATQTLIDLSSPLLSFANKLSIVEMLQKCNCTRDHYEKSDLPAADLCKQKETFPL